MQYYPTSTKYRAMSVKMLPKCDARLVDQNDSFAVLVDYSGETPVVPHPTIYLLPKCVMGQLNRGTFFSLKHTASQYHQLSKLSRLAIHVFQDGDDHVLVADVLLPLCMPRILALAQEEEDASKHRNDVEAIPSRGHCAIPDGPEIDSDDFLEPKLPVDEPISPPDAHHLDNYVSEILSDALRDWSAPDWGTKRLPEVLHDGWRSIPVYMKNHLFVFTLFEATVGGRFSMTEQWHVENPQLDSVQQVWVNDENGQEHTSPFYECEMLAKKFSAFFSLSVRKVVIQSPFVVVRNFAELSQEDKSNFIWSYLLRSLFRQISLRKPDVDSIAHPLSNAELLYLEDFIYRLRRGEDE